MRTSIAYLLLATLSLASCSSSQRAQNIDPSPSYLKSIESFTVNDELYSGFTNIFHYQASLLTDSLREQQLDYTSKVFRWDDEEEKKERRKLYESMANETLVFLSFYTPEIQYNDLNQSSSVWRVFLNVGGKRYSGKVTKVTSSFANLKNIYPQHSPWGYPYTLSFPVSMSSLKGQEASILITGSLGLSEKKFPQIPNQ